MNGFTSMSLGLPLTATKAKTTKGKGDPKTHLKKANAAHAAGNHAQAKRHALDAANALHAMTKVTPSAL